MSIPIKVRTGDVFTPNDDLMIGEVVVSPTNKRFGIGVGGVQPRWYPGLDKNNNLIMSYGTKFLMDNSDPRKPSGFGFENDDFVVRVNGTVVMRLGSLGVTYYGILRNNLTPDTYVTSTSGLGELLFPQYAGKSLVAAFGRPMFAGYLRLDGSYQVFRQITSFLSTFKGTFKRASAGSYYDDFGILRTADVNAPRLNHKPYSRKSRGLMLETTSKNLISPSFTLTAWTALNLTAVSTYSDSWFAQPYLEQPFVLKESADVNGVEHSLSKAISGPVNKRISGSFFFSPNLLSDTAYITHFIADAGRSNLFGVNLAIAPSGAVVKTDRTAGVASLDFYDIERISNNIYRCRYGGTLNSGATSNDDVSLTSVLATTDNTGNLIYTSAGGSKNLLVNAFQAERRDSVSSYIKTSTGPVVRGDETLTLLLDDFKFDPAEGTFDIEFVARNLTVGTIVGVLQNMAGTNRLEIYIVAVDTAAKTYQIGYRTVLNNVVGDAITTTTISSVKSFYSFSYADLPTDIRQAIFSSATGFNGSILLISYT